MLWGRIKYGGMNIMSAFLRDFDINTSMIHIPMSRVSFGSKLGEYRLTEFKVETLIVVMERSII